jgi:phenylpropionate dioxygenase-like ring-hydroxylating dioxygenase large terminal subunit
MSAYPHAVAAGWFPIATSRKLGNKPLARMLMDTPLVVFRGESGAAVLLDSCPHRNVALSAGRVRGNDIECPYHGWRFAGDGRCTATPGAINPATQRARAMPVVEQAGLIWTTLGTDAFPSLPPIITAPGFDQFWWEIPSSRAGLADAVENLLDPAHPHFLHAGIVRSAKIRRPVEVTVRVQPNCAEAIYVENTRAAAWMPRLLEGVRTIGIGRFMPPSTAQLIFEGPTGIRLAISVFFTPETVTSMRPFAHFATPRRLAPAIVKRALLIAFHFPVLLQDQRMLRNQTDNIARLNRAHYALGPLDPLRPAITALMAGDILNSSEQTFTLYL